MGGDENSEIRLLIALAVKGMWASVLFEEFVKSAGVLYWVLLYLHSGYLEILDKGTWESPGSFTPLALGENEKARAVLKTSSHVFKMPLFTCA